MRVDVPGGAIQQQRGVRGPLPAAWLFQDVVGKSGGQGTFQRGRTLAPFLVTPPIPLFST